MFFMKRLLVRFSLIFTYVLFLFFCFIVPAQAMDRSVIIGFHNKPGPSEKALLLGKDIEVKHKFRHISAYAAKLSEQAVERLRKDPRVKYVVEDTIYSVIDPVEIVADPVEDPVAEPIEYLNSWGVKHIGSQAAHSINITGSGVRVAILDSGIDYTHQELVMNYKGGWDFVFNDDDPYDDSWNSHGTHVAGIIAAAANGSGVVGVAPNAEIYALKVLDGAGFGLLSWIIEGIEWAIENKIDVVNVSIGGPHSVALQEACDAAYNAGVLLLAAAGNTYGGDVTFPAAYDSVIAVTGTDSADQRGLFAPFGPQIELAAPGVTINSTSVNDGYAVLSGTSQGAPHVSGLAALVLSAGVSDLNNDGKVNNQDVRMQLQMSAHDLGDPGKDDVYGYGLIDVSAALGIDGDGDDSSVSFELVRGTVRSSDNMSYTLSDMICQVSITNNSLSGVRVIVYENGSIRYDLSKKIFFNRLFPQETSFSLDARGTTLNIVFMPIGKPASSATITIDQ
ncbi:MAG: S8 family peptidase [Desulfocapsaceae bacterium]|nr:S8 family peptidase [Desulfocapsaceae bacterium]